MAVFFLIRVVNFKQSIHKDIFFFGIFLRYKAKCTMPHEGRIEKNILHYIFLFCFWEDDLLTCKNQQKSYNIRAHAK